MEQVRYFLIAVAFLSVLLSALGCSVTGWTAKEPPKGLNLNEGETITVTQKDGGLVTGEYTGIGTTPLENYVQEYVIYTEEPFEGKYLPVIGQKIEVLTSLSDTKVWEGEFLGFDHKSLWMQMKGKDQPEEIYFSSITDLSSRGGTVWPRMMLRSMFLDGKIPLRSAIRIRNANQTILIPVWNIKEISVRYSNRRGDHRDRYSYDGLPAIPYSFSSTR
ncbi:MAG: hypothetical protein ABSF91_15745 [Bacteroidota bacterium]